MNTNLTLYNECIIEDIDYHSSVYIKCVLINNEKIILKKNKSKKRYINEKKCYLLLKNENILPKLKYFDDDNYIIGLEYCGLSINKYRKKQKELKLKFNNDIINDKLIEFCDILFNKYNLYHNDLADRNVLIDDNNNIKLIDFEICRSELKKGRNKYLII